MAIIRAVVAGEPVPEVDPLLPSSIKTLSLASARCSIIKPQEGLKARLYRLKKNTGYPLEDLAREWVVSPETLRRDAKRLDALLYVESSPGEWIQCVVHPDTASERKA
jgi:hypothetical protein